MHLLPLSLASRIWAMGTVALAVPISSIMLSHDPAWQIGSGIAAAVAFRWGLGRVLSPLDKLRDRMADVSAETARQEIYIRAQNSLLTNIGVLRDALYAHGEPQQVGDKLYFGAKLINGNFEEVDYVKAVAGGTATVFLGDLRVATNVEKPDGTRAVGTKLAAGPTYDSVLGNGKTYRGEAEILGASYLTVYEPIVCDGKVIGILYVGVKKDAVRTESGDRADADALGEMDIAVATFEAAAMAKGKAELEAAEQRYGAEEARRQNDLLRKAAAAAQHNVVEALSIALDHLSAGDLLHRVDAAFPPEYVKLKQDFNAALDKLRAAMISIERGAKAMHLNSGEISQAADNLSRRTEQQAVTLEETAAALDEITSRVRETAEGAQRAREVVSDARSKAELSGEIVRKAVAAMSEIDASAQQIARIISVIDEIAFQTNLLALNAGVEAARAGDSGKGFAVVASEVRALAQRSADAAKQVRILITTSTTQVGAGVALVADTGKALNGIIERVAEINDLVQQIASSAREQASGLQQVNLAVNDMDKVTQQNAAMVEQSTAASTTLTDEAEQLVGMVGRFRIDEPKDPRSLAQKPAQSRRPAQSRYAASA